MTLQELTATIKQIEIKSRWLSNQLFAAQYNTAFKGSGMSFSEVRAYNYGDEVRNIDWNVSARFNEPFVKVFEEERELSLMLLIDVSASTLFGLKDKSKSILAAELVATLAFSALQNNDRVGAIFFSDKVEQIFTPKKGKQHVLKILRALLNSEYVNKSTNINDALFVLNKVCKRASIALIISDFFTHDYKTKLQLCASKHDVGGLLIYDERDATLPKLGLLPLVDLETNEVQYINTNNPQQMQQYTQKFTNHIQQTQSIFTSANAKFTAISTADDYTNKLMQYFNKK
jgi:uncharacterized protein (DUF58 family)